jgi:hypothetical protein
MKSLSEFAKTPELLEIVLDHEQIIAEYGEAITFYMHDYVDITTYFDFFRGQSEGGEAFADALRKIILNKDGLPILAPGQTLPVTLSIAVLSKINDNLGKLKTKSLTKETGNQPA